jgi:hypothetical protein
VVEIYIEDYCSPAFQVQEDGAITLAWRFNNLLGAMWIQMMRLLTATGSTRRFARSECTRIITFDPGQPPAEPGLTKNPRGNYKTRKDKKFCSDLCRVKNYQRKQRQRTNSA